MGAKIKFDLATRANILADYLDGATASAITEKYGCSYGYPAVLKNTFGTPQNVLNDVRLPKGSPEFARKNGRAPAGRPKPSQPPAVKAKVKIDVIDLARRYAAGEFDRHELSRRMRGEAA